MHKEWHRLEADGVTGLRAEMMPSGLISFRADSAMIDGKKTLGIYGFASGGLAIYAIGTRSALEPPTLLEGDIPATLAKALERFHREKVAGVNVSVVSETRP